jgi:hypothetical protein
LSGIPILSNRSAPAKMANGFVNSVWIGQEEEGNEQ